MKQEDVQTFIEEMELIGDEWTEEQAMDVFKDKTLEEALEERKSEVDTFLQTIAMAFINKK